MGKILKWLLIFTSLLLSLVLVYWLTTPFWLEKLINHYIANYGLHLHINKITTQWPVQLNIQNANIVNTNKQLLFKTEQLTLSLDFFSGSHQALEVVATSDKSSLWLDQILTVQAINSDISASSPTPVIQLLGIPIRWQISNLSIYKTNYPTFSLSSRLDQRQEGPQLSLKLKQNNQTVLTMNSQWQVQTQQLTGQGKLATAPLMTLLRLNKPLPLLDAENSELTVDLQFNLPKTFTFTLNDIQQTTGQGTIQLHATTTTGEASIKGNWQLQQGDISAQFIPNIQWQQPPRQSNTSNLSADKPDSLAASKSPLEPPQKVTFACKTPLEVIYKLSKQYTNISGECLLGLFHPQYKLHLNNQLEGTDKLTQWHIYTTVSGHLGSSTEIESQLTSKVHLKNNSFALKLVDSSETSISKVVAKPVTTGKMLLLIQNLSAEVTHFNNPIKSLKLHATIDVATNHPSISGYPLAAKLSGQHQIKIANQQLNYHASWQLDSVANLQSQMRWQLAKKQATISWLLDIKEIDRLAKPISTVMPNWPNQFSITSGKLTHQFSGSMLFTPFTLTGSTKTKIKQMNLVYDETKLNNINGKLQLKVAKNHLSSTKLTDNILTVDLVEAGIPIKSVSSQLQIHANPNAPSQAKIQLKQLKASLLGGAVTAPEFSLLPFSDQKILVTVKALDLAKLVALEQQPTITANGKINGKLPIEIINNKPSIRKGSLQSLGEGWIKVKKHPSTDTLQSSNESLSLALSALENFHYDQLSSDVELAPNGDLTLYVRLAGKNPDFYQGKRIHFNYKQEENIYLLIKSIRLGQYIGENVTEKLQQPSKD